MRTRLFLTLFLWLFGLTAVLAKPALLKAQTTIPAEPQFNHGVVTQILETNTGEIGGYTEVSQSVAITISDGQSITATYILPQGTDNSRLLREGMRVVVVSQQLSPNSEPEHVVTDLYRLPSLLFIFLIFIGVIIAFAGLRGATALAGLGFSIALLLYWIVPQIAAGVNPLFVGLIGAVIIGGVSIFLAHGFNRRTIVAAGGMFITLALAVIAAISFVSLSDIFGLGSEAALELQYGATAPINLRGLLLAGIIIGALGVLDDITTAQSAAIEEIHRANPKLGFNEIYRRGMSVGREHITSLVNTLALAYAGASLPLLLLFTVYQQPLWVTLNGEFVAEEVVRTVVGSLALALAVPITTLLAAMYFTQQISLEKTDKRL